MSWLEVLGDDAVVARDAVGLPDGALAHLGDPVGETRSLLEGARTIVPLSTLGAVTVRGDDRIDFVNGQLSHDVRGLSEGGARAMLLLDHRGRPQADVIVVRRRDELYLAVADGAAEHVHGELERHVVFDQVSVHRSRSLVAMVAAGDDVVALLDDALGAGAAAREALADAGRAVSVAFGDASVLLHARRRARRPSIDIHARSAELPALWAALSSEGARPAGEAALAAARVDAGIPAAAAEGVEALPQEAGMEELISYRKGCYLGQEIMARIEARGTLRRRLARVGLRGAPVDAAARAIQDDAGRTVGRVGTAALLPDGRWAALAVLRTDVRPGAVLHALGVQLEAGASMQP